MPQNPRGHLSTATFASTAIAWPADTALLKTRIHEIRQPAGRKLPGVPGHVHRRRNNSHAPMAGPGDNTSSILIRDVP
jgi:hypothetical protein